MPLSEHTNMISERAYTITERAHAITERAIALYERARGIPPRVPKMAGSPRDDVSSTKWSSTAKPSSAHERPFEVWWITSAAFSPIM